MATPNDSGNAFNNAEGRSTFVTTGPQDLEQIVFRALNEHGFLFQSRVAELFSDKGASRWKLSAVEYPVSFGPLFQETKIDLILHRGAARDDLPDWHAVIECKRYNPDFKTWLFFGDCHRGTDKVDALHFQSGHMAMPEAYIDGRRKYDRRVISFPVPDFLQMSCFSYYLEARERISDKKCSATQAIEDAFEQATLGATALVSDIERVGSAPYRVVPIVVTTAELVHVKYTSPAVSLDRGEIKASDLTVQPMDWLCVNYAIGDKVAHLAGVERTNQASLRADLSRRLVRSIFVVRPTSLEAFLTAFDGIVDRNLK